MLDLHMVTNDTPAHRLEQTNAGGFTAQTWDIAGNEANFFVRDVTGGSRLPFRIRPGAGWTAGDCRFQSGKYGDAHSTSGSWTGTANSNTGCDTALRLYCFEQ